MGVASLFLGMFLRKLNNRSGSISVQIISKAAGKYKVVSTIGSGHNEQEVQNLWFLGKQELERLSKQSHLFVSENDHVVDQVFDSLIIVFLFESMILNTAFFSTDLILIFIVCPF